MLGASHAAPGISIRIMPPPPSALSVVAGNTDPHACSVPLNVLPLAVSTVLPHRWTWPLPAIDAVAAGQLTLTTVCEASANVVRGAHTLPLPPVPVAPAVPAAPALPAAPPPSGLTSESLLDPQAPASAISVPTAAIVDHRMVPSRVSRLLPPTAYRITAGTHVLALRGVVRGAVQ